MLLRTDPFAEFDRLAQQFFGGTGTRAHPAAMPMDAYRRGDEFVVCFDLPGADPDSIDLDAEGAVLTVKAERSGETGEHVEYQVSERPRGVFSHQLFLGDTLDVEHIQASYDAGVLTLRIPVADHAKPRKIEITSGEQAKQINA
ncbi:Hsp20/alpha crystallin family protein [Amycolatopsis sp. NPDC059657]|uniref:Hsp20/alpha crystallin family protein n=1 Tax=Amycolatopsis sp. NPDC059657 TaxID=3346899 RepID=UPI00366E3B6A